MKMHPVRVVQAGRGTRGQPAHPPLSGQTAGRTMSVPSGAVRGHRGMKLCLGLLLLFGGRGRFVGRRCFHGVFELPYAPAD